MSVAKLSRSLTGATATLALFTGWPVIASTSVPLISKLPFGAAAPLFCARNGAVKPATSSKRRMVGRFIASLL
jgi:hypothetical protein